MMKKDCNFCNVEDVRPQILFENENALIIYPRTPVIKGHFMVIPRNHVELFHELSDADLKGLRDLTQLIINAYNIPNADGYNIINNNGKVAGQHVAHVHLHVLLRFSNEPKSPLDILAGKIERDDFYNEKWQELFDELKSKFDSHQKY